MRKFNSGGTRSEDNGKIDYAHHSALAERIWCEYMHEHRIQEDGQLREPDNYKKGMPIDTYIKSLRGHFADFNLLMEGHRVFEGDKEVTLFDAIMAMKFNLQGIILETMRGCDVPRKFTNGELKKLFNEKIKEIK